MTLGHHTRVIMTDASLDGWSGVLLPQRVTGVWTSQDLRHSMNWLELRAIQLSLHYYASELRGRVVKVLADNSTALSCLKNQGSLRSTPLMDLTSQILEFCQRLNITLVPVHLRGVLMFWRIWAPDKAQFQQSGHWTRGPFSGSATDSAVHR